MLNRLSFGFTAFLVAFAITSLSAQSLEKTIPGELLIEMPEGVVPADALPQLKPYSLSYQKLSPAFPVWLVKYDAAKWNGEVILSRLRESGKVVNAQYNHRVQKRDRFPNDSLFPEQWSLRNTGEIPNYLKDADINAPAAWDFTTGGVTLLGDTIVVAVVDGGFDIHHPDLNFWKNRHEIPNNKIDDDLNGYIDDYDGWNAYTDSGQIEVDAHGTHVAGIVGARGNNITGTTGVNWNVQVMAIEGASELESDVVKAYGYLYTMRKLYNQTNGLRGAFIVASNSSFGVDFGRPQNFPIWCGLYDKMGELGILNAVATANDNIDVEIEGDIPSTCTSPYTIVVTNTTARDKRSAGAAYGKESVDIGAPGASILSTIPDGEYGYLSGTSMSTPHVAGAIGLLYAGPCANLGFLARTNPGQAALFTKSVLLNNARPLAGFDTLVTSGGRLDIGKSMQQLTAHSYDCGPSNNRAIDLSRVFPNPGRNKVTVRYLKRKELSGDLLMYTVTGQLVLTVNTSNQAAGEYAIDINTSSLAPGIYIMYLQADGVQSNIMKVLLF
jgi:hypothetical protein